MSNCKSEKIYFVPCLIFFSGVALLINNVFYSNYLLLSNDKTCIHKHKLSLLFPQIWYLKCLWFRKIFWYKINVAVNILLFFFFLTYRLTLIIAQWKEVNKNVCLRYKGIPDSYFFPLLVISKIFFPLFNIKNTLFYLFPEVATLFVVQYKTIIFRLVFLTFILSRR